MESSSSEAPSHSLLLVSEDEKRILDLYDRLQQLQLEIALITAQKNFSPEQLQSRGIESAQNDVLESRARYVLRNEVAESIVMANPVLQAVHGGTNASPIEKDLLPVLADRDSSSVTMAQQSTTLRQITEEIMNVESESMLLSRQNVELAAELLALTEQANKHKTLPVEDPEQAEEIGKLDKDVKASRQRWRVMKATASAIVAGSGVDWAGDDKLRSIVLDDADDGV